MFLCGREYTAFIKILKGFLMEKRFRTSYRKELWIEIPSFICWEALGESSLPYLNTVQSSLSKAKQPHRYEGD